MSHGFRFTARFTAFFLGLAATACGRDARVVVHEPARAPHPSAEIQTAPATEPASPEEPATPHREIALVPWMESHENPAASETAHPSTMVLEEFYGQIQIFEPQSLPGETEEDARPRGLLGALSTRRMASPYPATEVAAVINQASDALEHCYRQSFGELAPRPGRVTVRLLVRRNGKVRDVAVMEGQAEQDSNSCFVETLQQWQFPRLRGGTSLTLELPLTFAHDE